MSTSPITPIDPITAARISNKAVHRPYYIRIFVALDKFLNVILFNGLLDETISAHSARAALEGKTWGALMLKFLNIFDKNHGAGAIVDDQAEAQVIVNFEENTHIVESPVVRKE